MLRGRNPLKNESAEELTSEPHPAPHPRLRRLGLRRRHQVVKDPIKMRQRHLNQNPSHRQLISNNLGGDIDHGIDIDTNIDLSKNTEDSIELRLDVGINMDVDLGIDLSLDGGYNMRSIDTCK